MAAHAARAPNKPWHEPTAKQNIDTKNGGRQWCTDTEEVARRSNNNNKKKQEMEKKQPTNIHDTEQKSAGSLAES